MTAALTRAGVPCSSRGVWVTVTVDRSSGRLSSQVSFRWLLLIIDSRVVRFYTDAGMSSQHMHRRLVLSSIILPAAMIAALYLALPGGSPRFASAQISTQPNVIASLFVRSNPPAGQAIASSHPSAMAAGAAFAAAIPSDAMTLDPALMIDRTSFLVTAQLYDTLTTYQPGGSVPMPGLADNWTVSPDGKTWTFNLHPGVKFHDGTNLDAGAVAYNFGSTVESV